MNNDELMLNWNVVVSALDSLLKGEIPKGLDGLAAYASLDRSLQFMLEFMKAQAEKEPCDCDKASE